MSSAGIISCRDVVDIWCDKVEIINKCLKSVSPSRLQSPLLSAKFQPFYIIICSFLFFVALFDTYFHTEQAGPSYLSVCVCRARTRSWGCTSPSQGCSTPAKSSQGKSSTSSNRWVQKLQPSETNAAPALLFVCREMKKGNIGTVMGMFGKKMRNFYGGSVDLGLTGKDGVVHPSLEVKSPPVACWCDLAVHPLLCHFCFLFEGKCKEIWAERPPFWNNSGGSAVQIWKGNTDLN